jgi:xanthine dehydrogenase molybdopterin-binding subunit B
MIQEFYKKKKIHQELPDLETNYGLALNFQNGHVVVWINDAKEIEHEVLNTIIHESVHVFQSTMLRVGEEAPGKETEAYLIAEIATNLIAEYTRLVALKES